MKPTLLHLLDAAARDSLSQQAEVEAGDTQNIDGFVEDYQRSLNSLTQPDSSTANT